MRHAWLLALAIPAMTLMVMAQDEGKAITDPKKIVVIATEDMVNLVKTGSVIILDARIPQFDDGRRIPGAISLPSDSSDELIVATLRPNDGEIVTYCSDAKCTDADKLAKRLIDLRYTDVGVYQDGIEGWIKAGHEVEETMPSP